MNQALLEKAEQFVRARFSTASPVCGLILGTGWNSLADFFTIKGKINYHDIPGLGSPSITGHSGCLLLSSYAGVETFIFQGRRHWYESCGWESIALPIYLLKSFGGSVLVVTNAAGGIRNDLKPGAFMVIDDHINAMATHPLIGHHDSFWCRHFPDQTDLYALKLRNTFHESALCKHKKLAHGTYLAVSGPTYETPAEVRAMKILGADAVGSSTVPEVILANAAGLSVLGISCIANMATGISSSLPRHDEIVATVMRALPEITGPLQEFWKKLLTANVTNKG